MSRPKSSIFLFSVFNFVALLLAMSLAAPNLALAGGNNNHPTPSRPAVPERWYSIPGASTSPVWPSGPRVPVRARCLEQLIEQHDRVWGHRNPPPPFIEVRQLVRYSW